jgi:hypothetical protein
MPWQLQLSTSTNVVLSAVLCLLITTVLHTRPCSHSTKLNGPSRISLLLGLVKTIFKPSANGSDLIDLVAEWEAQHGAAFRLPSLPGMNDRILLCDPKAVFHHYSNDTYIYRQSPSTRQFFMSFVSC